MAPDRVYVDRGLTGTNLGATWPARSAGRVTRPRPTGGDQARPARPFPCPAPEPSQASLNLRGSVYDPNDAVGRLLFNVLALVAESDLIRLRTRECMMVAKAKGPLRGKQPKLNPRQEAHLVSPLHSGDYSSAEAAELFGVGRSTVYRAIERHCSEAGAKLVSLSRPAVEA